MLDNQVLSAFGMSDAATDAASEGKAVSFGGHASPLVPALEVGVKGNNMNFETSAEQ